MGGTINVDPEGVRRAANGKLDAAADGTKQVAARLEALNGGAGLGGSGAAAALAAREVATQQVFAATLQQAHQELATHRDNLVRGMDNYETAEADSAASTSAIEQALPTLTPSAIRNTFDESRSEAGEALEDRIGGDDELPMTAEQEELAAEANADGDAGTDASEAPTQQQQPLAGSSATGAAPSTSPSVS